MDCRAQGRNHAQSRKRWQLPSWGIWLSRPLLSRIPVHRPKIELIICQSNVGHSWIRTGLKMAAVGLRKLSRETREVIERLEESREPVLIVRRGKPIAALVAVDGENLNQLLLAGLPEFVEERRRADEELANSQTRPLGEVMAEIEANEPEDEEELPEEGEGSFHDLLLAWKSEL